MSGHPNRDSYQFACLMATAAAHQEEFFFNAGLAGATMPQVLDMMNATVVPMLTRKRKFKAAKWALERLGDYALSLARAQEINAGAMQSAAKSTLREPGMTPAQFRDEMEWSNAIADEAAIPDEQLQNLMIAAVEQKGAPRHV